MKQNFDSMWLLLATQTPSGKTQFACKCCGHVSIAPDKVCGECGAAADGWVPGMHYRDWDSWSDVDAARRQMVQHNMHQMIAGTRDTASRLDDPLRVSALADCRAIELALLRLGLDAGRPIIGRETPGVMSKRIDELKADLSLMKRIIRGEDDDDDDSTSWGGYRDE